MAISGTRRWTGRVGRLAAASVLVVVVVLAAVVVAALHTDVDGSREVGPEPTMPDPVPGLVAADPDAPIPDPVVLARVLDPLAADPALRRRFEEKLRSDPEFAGSPAARLDFFYRLHPAWDRDLNRYPVLRLDTQP